MNIRSAESMVQIRSHTICTVRFDRGRENGMGSKSEKRGEESERESLVRVYSLPSKVREGNE